MVQSPIYLPNLFAKYSRKGKASYAAITGSSDGIGEEYAYHLARQGFNIILISRTLSKLERVKSEILKQCPKCDVVIVQADFEKNTNVPFYEKLMVKISSYDIGIAIICAGVFPMGTYEQMSNRDIQQQIDVNVYQYGMLGKMLLDFLSKRDHPTLLSFIGSVAGYGPLPGLNMYAASKGFVYHFADGSAYEIYGSKLDISNYTPMGILTPMTKDFSNPDSLISEDIVDIAVTTAVRSHIQDVSSPVSRYVGVSYMGYWSNCILKHVLMCFRDLLPDTFNGVILTQYQEFTDNQIANWKRKEEKI